MYCKKCGKEITENSTFCPECGANQSTSSDQQPISEVPPQKKKRGCLISAIVVVGVIILIIIIAAISGGDKGSNTSNNENTPISDSTKASDSNINDTNSTPSTTTYKAGTYKVGTDIPSGEYLATAKGSGYYQITSDSTGKIDSIKSNDNFYGTRYITLDDGEYLKLDRATMIPVAEISPQEPKDGKYPEGMYKVGYDIAAGEYKISAKPGQMAYVEVCTNSGSDHFSNIVSNDNFEGDSYITVSNGQYLKIDRGEIIVP